VASGSRALGSENRSVLRESRRKTKERARARARDEGNYHPPRPPLRLFALRLSSSRKSHLPRGDVGGRCGNLLGARILRGSTRTKRAPGQGRRIHAETGASERERFHYSGVFAQRHPLRKRRATPKTNQTGRDGMRGPPGGNRRWFHARTHERRSAEVQIAPPSGLHRANGKPPQRSEGGDAAALTLCYDKYIFLFGLLIRARRYRPRERASRVIRTIDGALFGRREASRRRCGRLSARLLVFAPGARVFKLKISTDIFILYFIYTLPLRSEAIQQTIATVRGSAFSRQRDSVPRFPPPPPPPSSRERAGERTTAFRDAHRRCTRRTRAAARFSRREKRASHTTREQGL